MALKSNQIKHILKGQQLQSLRTIRFLAFLCEGTWNPIVLKAENHSVHPQRWKRTEFRNGRWTGDLGINSGSERTIEQIRPKIWV